MAKNGIVTIECGQYIENIDVNTLDSWEKLEAVKSAILRAGFVWTRKIEKMARKNLSV